MTNASRTIMLGFGGLLKKIEANPDGFELKKDYRNLKRISPEYEKLPNTGVKGSELDELLREYAGLKRSVLDLSLPEKTQKKQGKGLFLEGVYDKTIAIEPIVQNIDNGAFEKYKEHRFTFEKDDNRYTFDTVVLGKTKEGLYIAEKPKGANEEKVPYRGFKTAPPTRPIFRDKEVVELGKKGVIFTSNESYPMEERIEGAKLYLPDINSKNTKYSGGTITIPEAVVKYKTPGCRMTEYGVEFTDFKSTNDKKKLNDFLFALKRANIYS